MGKLVNAGFETGNYRPDWTFKEVDRSAVPSTTGSTGTANTEIDNIAGTIAPNVLLGLAAISPRQSEAPVQIVTAATTDPNPNSGARLDPLVQYGQSSLRLGNPTGDTSATPVGTASILTQQISNITTSTLSIDWQAVLYTSSYHAASSTPSGFGQSDETLANASFVEFVVEDQTSGMTYVDGYVARSNETQTMYGFTPGTIIQEVGNVAGPGNTAFAKGASNLNNGNSADSILNNEGGEVWYTKGWQTETFAVQQGHSYRVSIITADNAVGHYPAYVYLDAPSTTSFEIDKQVLLNGAPAQDVGVAVRTGPSTVVGQTVQYDDKVTNTGDTTLTNILVTDGDLPGGSATIASLAPGATVDLLSQAITAQAGHHDSATASARVSDTAVASASDYADYNGLAASIQVDKQVSVDGGSTWTDRGQDILDNPIIAAGQTVQFRDVVTNTGGVDLTGITVTDDDLAGGSATLSRLAMNASPVILPGVAGSGRAASSGHITTVATVSARDALTGTVVTATDHADYTGDNPGITVDLQISTDNATWFDQGRVRSGDPVLVPGQQYYLRALITNNGLAAVSGITLSSPIVPRASFGSIPTLQSGQQAYTTSSVRLPAGAVSSQLAISATGRSAAAGAVEVTDSDAVGYTIASVPVFTITSNTVPTPEPTGGSPSTYTFTVHREGGAGLQSSLAYQVAGSGNVPAPNDALVALGNSVVFGATETDKQIQVNVRPGTALQDEGFAVTLAAPAIGTLQTASAGAVILRNSGTQPAIPTSYRLTASSLKISVDQSGQSVVTLNVHRSAASLDTAETLSYQVQLGGANTADPVLFDAGQLSGPVMFNAGRADATFSLTITGVAITADQTFTVAISSGNAVVASIGETVLPNFAGAALPPGFAIFGGGQSGTTVSGSGGGSSTGDASRTIPSENDVIRISASAVGIDRYFDTSNGTHFYTASASEAAASSSVAHLKFEGTGFGAVDPLVAQLQLDPNAVAVFRFFDTRFGTHFYTDSAAETVSLQQTRSADLTFEGTGFYEHATAQAGDTAVYRFYDTSNGTHFFTANADERASVLASRPDLKDEGVAFYAPSANAV